MTKRSRIPSNQEPQDADVDSMQSLDGKAQVGGICNANYEQSGRAVSILQIPTGAIYRFLPRVSGKLLQKRERRLQFAATLSPGSNHGQKDTKRYHPRRTDCEVAETQSENDRHRFQPSRESHLPTSLQTICYFLK